MSPKAPYAYHDVYMRDKRI